MVRLILGVIVGLIVGMIVIFAVEGVGHTIFPPPAGVNLTDPAQMATVMSVIPFQAKIAILLAWLFGTVAGASSANLIAGRRAWAGRIVTLLVLALSIFNMTTIVHPVWMMVAAVAAILAAGVLAERAFGRRRL
ncbi:MULTISPECIES: hypothetical protein [Phenylobacterium]|uniref:Uncharacterized protein (DUF983 family) n=1 Tax=Phenylobacterium koreense TaxID=266125 RepID=A0ABV2EGF7_9CAUL